MKTSFMKYMMLLVGFLPLLVFGQRESYDFINIENHTCASATKVCGPINQPFYIKASEENPEVVVIPAFYYVFDFVTANTNGISFNVQYTNANYVWYGPLSGDNYCESIENYTANYITGTINNNGVVSLSNQVGRYILQMIPTEPDGIIRINAEPFPEMNCVSELPCTNCVTSFLPSPGKYVVSAWVKEDGANTTTTTYTKPSIDVTFVGSGFNYNLIPEGRIIDGWQRIEKEVFVPYGATTVEIKLQTSSGDAYFDDIRFFPTDGSMMSYVYDPVSLRLMAELDERNYATLYEYDEEGKLIRVKKETEKGIMTIQENRDNIKKP